MIKRNAMPVGMLAWAHVFRMLHYAGVFVRMRCGS
jgi:hypothetical protein